MIDSRTKSRLIRHRRSRPLSHSTDSGTAPNYLWPEPQQLSAITELTRWSLDRWFRRSIASTEQQETRLEYSRDAICCGLPVDVVAGILGVTELELRAQLNLPAMPNSGGSFGGR